MPSLTSLKDTWYRTYLPLKNTSSFKRLTKTQAFLKNLKTKNDSKPFTICKKAPSPEFPSSLLQIPLVLPVFNLKSNYYGLLRYLGRPSFSVVLWFILQASLSWIAFCIINFNSWSSVSFFFFNNLWKLFFFHKRMNSYIWRICSRKSADSLLISCLKTET